MAASTGTGNYDAVVQSYTANDSAFISTGHTVTLTDNVTGCNFFRIDAGATLVGGGFSITIDNDSSDNSFINNGTISGVLDVIITNPNGTSFFNANGQGGNVRNLTVNHASAVVKLKDEDQTLDGNLTITAGELTTNDGSADRNLTVAGVVDNDGTLTFNGSTVNLGSTSSQAGDFQGSGTFNLDTSTINFHTAGSANFNPSTSANFDTNTSTLNLIGLDSSTRAHNFTYASGNLHNITTSRGTGSGTHIDKLNGNTTITGNLTVGANSKFSSGTRVFTVNGDVNITGELDCDDSDKPMTFGTLTIASGGTYQATSGTTTITQANGAPVNGRCWFIPNSATFTHNNGLCKFTASSPQVEMVSSGGTSTPNPFYDVEQTTGTMQWKGEHTKVLNNATLRGSQFNGSTGNLTVLGICRFTAGTFNASDTSTSDNSFFGTLVIESGATVDLSAIDITVGSVRNLGGTIQ